MARLDPFIQALHQHDAEALQLVPGKPASLLIGGALRAVTRDPLVEAQILSLLQEIQPPGEPGRFEYVAPSGSVAVEGDGQGVTIRRIVAAARPVAVAGAAAAAPAASAARGEMERLLRLTAETGASDLHLRTGQAPILRKDGELVRQEGAALTADVLDAMLTSLMGARDVQSFRETGDADWAHELPGLARFRCNAAMERVGPMGVFRVIPSKIVTVEQLGISPEVQRLCHLTKGLVLVTGPTGSGKSTTLAALVDLANRTRSDHILTIEDPIEFVHPPQKCVVTQRQVGEHTRTFKAGLRAALREDPDIIMVGEMRDLETVAIAIETAETGHLVFGTLHTTTAASTIDRIIDQFPADRQSQVRVMLAESLKGVVAQVLCRRTGGGRVAAMEVLLSIPAVSNLIREGKTFQIPSIMQTNKKTGMVLLNDALLDLVEKKVVEPQEAYAKSVEKTSFVAGLKAKRIDTSFLGES